MKILYPSDPFDKNSSEKIYLAEFNKASEKGISRLLFLPDDFEMGIFRTIPKIEKGDKILYRGWMLTVEQYQLLEKAVSSKGAKLIVNTEKYQLSHYLPKWYPLCSEFTPESIFFNTKEDLLANLPQLDWNAYFVKDYVKSLTTERGSIAKNKDEIFEILNLIEKYRGSLEGGISLRRVEKFCDESEERYFIANGKAFSRNDIMPDAVLEIAKKIQSPFFSVDTVIDNAGKTRVIELGDGQVSDIKKWQVQRFVQVLLELKSM